MRADFYSFLAQGQSFRMHRLLPSTHAHGESDENKSAKQESINIVHKRLRQVDSDISAYTYERTLMMEQRSQMLKHLKQRRGTLTV
ncbi:hypothetical protein AVEN_125487-1, partial [Araneus ventricosus]